MEEKARISKRRKNRAQKRRDKGEQNTESPKYLC